ncbi:MAG: hypothetical protein AAF567_08935 [Actinomycetota bacterium]
MTTAPQAPAPKVTSVPGLMSVLVLVVFVAASCGSAASRPTVGAEEAAVDPFDLIPPVPTTAPIVLPPEDLDIPETAPIVIDLAAETPTIPSSDGTVPVEDETSTTTTVVTSSPDDASGGTSASLPAPAEPAGVSADPASAESSSAATTPTGQIVSIDRWNPCIVSEAETLGAEHLLDPIAAATSTDLTSQQLNSLAAASASCGVVTESLGLTDLDSHLASGTDCMNQWLASTGGGAVFTGLASVTFGHATPNWAYGHFTASIASCFVGTTFASEVMSDVAADPSLVVAFDASCLATGFDASNTIENYAAALAATPDSATLNVGLGDTWVVGCANLGRLVASAAAVEGVVLSESTIACLDTELRAAGLVDGLLNGTADTTDVGIATISCLTDAEAAVLLS